MSVIDSGEDRWGYSLARSHKIAVEAVLIDGSEETDLVVADGSVTLDSTAATRGRLDLTLATGANDALVPSEPTDPLAPYGNEIRVSRGIEYPEGDRELVALGVFRIEDLDVDDSGDALVVRLSGLDRSARVIDARFEEPYQIEAGTNYGTAILEVVQAAYPEVDYDFAPTSLVTPALFAEEGEDRWEFAQQMALSIGCELFFNGEGTLVLQPVTQAGAGSPDWEIAEGEGGVLVQASRRWTREGAFNRVIAVGENSSDESPPVRGIATDENPNSPTYYYGAFGRVPRFYQSEFLVTDAQCQAAAQAILSKELGTSQTVQFGSVVNPKMTPGDVVRINRERAGIEREEHVLDRLTIPLSASGEADGQTRAVQVI